MTAVDLAPLQRLAVMEQAMRALAAGDDATARELIAAADAPQMRAATTPDSLPFPILPDVPNVPADLQSLAEATQAALNKRAAWATGMHDFGLVSGGQLVQSNRSFGVTFASSPVVLLTLQDSDLGFVINASSITTTGFNLVAKNIATGASVARIRWVALGNR